MKLSKRGEYALRALIDIGIAHELGRPLVQVAELAEKENLPLRFLEQILIQLKEGGYIASKRGKLGGYHLLKPARKVRIGQVIRFIDGPLAPIGCVSLTAYEPCTCPDQDHCGLHMIMADVRAAVSAVLDRFTLAETVEMMLRKVRRTKASIPFLEAVLARPPGKLPATRRPAGPAPRKPVAKQTTRRARAA